MSLLPTYLPAALALLSAFLFALSDQLAHRGLVTADARSGAVVSLVICAAVFWVFAPWLMQASYWLTGTTALFAAVGIFRPALSIYLALMGIGYLGPTLASAFSATSPLWGSALAVTILGEHITPAIAAGTAAVMAGAVLASLRPQGVARHWPLWALLFPLGAALIRGCSHVVTKYGYQEIPSPYFAALIAATVSAVLSTIVFLWQGRRFKGTGGLGPWWAAYKWFLISGALNGLAFFTLNTALAKGSVVTVMPVASAGPVFTLLLGLIVFRSEGITWRTAATIALVVPGIILVVLR